jgi:hypothetical protein
MLEKYFKKEKSTKEQVKLKNQDEETKRIERQNKGDDARMRRKNLELKI